MKLKPVNGYLLVKRIKKEKKSSIILQQEEFEPFYELVETDISIKDYQFKTGDQIFVDRHSIKNLNAIENLFLVKHENVSAILEK